MIELLLQAERAMSVGLVDRAEVLYEQVADADPKNSIAVVGLARVRLERGDETGALELARRALVIDPENAAAERMVERLEEVLAYRGVETAETMRTQEVEPVGPEAGSAAEPEPEPPEPEPEPEPEPAAEPEPTPEPTPPALAPQPAPAATPVPKRRSWLDRLFRRR